MLTKFAIPATVGVALLQNSIYDVKGGSRAVIFDRVAGVKETVVNEGTHFLIPWLQKAIVFDVRTKPRIIPTTTGSKDLQMVSLTLRVLHRPEVQALPKIYQVRLQLEPAPSDDYLYDGQLTNCYSHRTSVKITTSVSSPLSATKSSSPSSPSSTPPSSSPSARPSRSASAPTWSSAPPSSILRSRTFPSPT